jgi:hypothetical protein
VKLKPPRSHGKNALLQVIISHHGLLKAYPRDRCDRLYWGAACSETSRSRLSCALPGAGPIPLAGTSLGGPRGSGDRRCAQARGTRPGDERGGGCLLPDSRNAGWKGQRGTRFAGGAQFCTGSRRRKHRAHHLLWRTGGPHRQPISVPACAA